MEGGWNLRAALWGAPTTKQSELFLNNLTHVFVGNSLFNLVQVKEKIIAYRRMICTIVYCPMFVAVKCLGHLGFLCIEHLANTREILTGGRKKEQQEGEEGSMAKNTASSTGRIH